MTDTVNMKERSLDWSSWSSCKLVTFNLFNEIQPLIGKLFYKTNNEKQFTKLDLISMVQANWNVDGFTFRYFISYILIWEFLFDQIGNTLLYTYIDPTLVNSLHWLLNCKIGWLDCHVITTEYRTRVIVYTCWNKPSVLFCSVSPSL